MSSGFNGPSPFEPHNPYSSPQQFPQAGPPGYYPGRDPNQAAKAKVMGPAIALICVAGLGLLASMFNFVFALVGLAPVVDPNAPEFIQVMQRAQTGPTTAIAQFVFVIVNAVIIGGGVQMLRMKMYPYAITASVLAMLNFGTCCCIFGIPVGIWSMIVLMMADVANAFDRS